MKESTKRIAVGTLIAASAGYIAGILTAPKSGKETRKELKESAQKSYSEAEKQLKKLHTELNDVIEQAKDKGSKVTGRAKEELDNAVDVAKQVKEKAREILSAVHEGDAEDKDLKKAVSDAQKAVEHLKTYLSKRA